MKINLYNFLTRKKEVFKPLKKGKVGLYTCGPTVYSYPHIGNYRAYVFEDILRRTLEYGGLKVKHVMNITDVDDKTIRDSVATGKTLKDFTSYYSDAFFSDLKKLNIEEAWKYSFATEHIAEMIALIKILLKKKIAYKTDDGVYFDISKFKKYGRLSQLKKREIKIGARVDNDEYEKGSAEDFVLWKAAKTGEPSWPSPFGEGRPGWHIECSAMSMKYLGSSFDIHAGGIDLLFPHHENEIAQSEAATGKKFVNYFLESGHLQVNGQKMSKSLGNIFTMDDLSKKGFSPLAFRYLLLGAHYRTQLNFTWESLQSAQTSLNNILRFVNDLKNIKAGISPISGKGKIIPGKLKPKWIKEFRDKFNEAIFDDLNTPKALAVMWGVFQRYIAKSEEWNSEEVLDLFFNFDLVLGLGFKEYKEKPIPPIPENIKKLVDEREMARKSRDFISADILRQKIYDLGWEIQDSKEGPLLRKPYYNSPWLPGGKS